jgi:large subunit ribosomal protein L29
LPKRPRPKVEDIRKLSEEDLEKELEETYRRYFAVNLQKETLQLTNHRRPPVIRKQIARILTIRRQRAITRAAQAGGEGS